MVSEPNTSPFFFILLRHQGKSFHFLHLDQAIPQPSTPHYLLIIILVVIPILPYRQPTLVLRIYSHSHRNPMSLFTHNSNRVTSFSPSPYPQHITKIPFTPPILSFLDISSTQLIWYRKNDHLPLKMRCEKKM